jgi:hypothetical protein
MSEALKALRGRVPWLNDSDAEEYVPPRKKTPAEDVEELVMLSRQAGTVDRASPTWAAVSRWAAQELIAGHYAMETASIEKAAALRARSKALRDLLEMDRKNSSSTTIEDIGPDIP